MGDQTCGTLLPLFTLSVVRLACFEYRVELSERQLRPESRHIQSQCQQLQALFLRLYGVAFQAQLSLQTKQLLCYDTHFKLRIITITKTTSLGSSIGTATS